MRSKVRVGVVAVAVVGFGSEAAAQEDPWFGPDKAAHFGVSAALAAGGYGAGVVVFEGRGEAVALGAGISLGAGAAKEVYDAAGDGSASWRDLAWDAAGAAAGLGVAVAVDLLLTGGSWAPSEDARASARVVGSSGLTLRF